MRLEKKIASAINDSILHNHITHLTVAGDSSDVIVAANAVADDGEIYVDHTMFDNEGIDTLDIWGCDVITDCLVWRLNIRFE